SALHLVAELASDGVDLRRFVAEGVAFFRGVFLAHYAPNLEEIADEPADVLDMWRKAAASLPAAEVLRAVDVLGEALIRLREGRGALGAVGGRGAAPRPAGPPRPIERPAEEIPPAGPEPGGGAAREESRPAPAASEPGPAPQSKAGEPPLQFSQLQEIWPSLF